MLHDRESEIKQARDLLNACLNDKDLDSLPQFVKKETIIQSPLRSCVGLDSFKGLADVWLKAFPDIQCKEKKVSVHDDCIRIDWEVTGTHLGDFLSISPTGKSVVFQYPTKFSFVDHHLLTYASYTDVKGITNQLIDYGLEYVANQTSHDIYRIINTPLGVNLSNRQIECVALSMLYLTTQKIANILDIERGTAQKYLDRAFEVLGVSNRNMLFDFAVNQHVVELLLRIGLFLRNKHG